MKPLFASPRSVSLLHQELLGRDVDEDEFLRYTEPCASGACGAVLLSGGLWCNDGESRYSIAAWDPFAVFETKGDVCSLKTPKGVDRWMGDSLDSLDHIFAAFSPDFPLITPPFTGGAIGYFAYDLKNRIERLPQTALDDLDLPDIFLFWPRQLLIHDRALKDLHWLTLNYQGDSSTAPEQARPRKAPSLEKPFRVDGLCSNFSHRDYIRAVTRVRQYIREGDVYQVNLSQRYRFSLKGDPFHLWKCLFNVNPAPFYAFVQAGDHQVLSTSMERFLYRSGSIIETRPIKGTRKRGISPDEDEQLKIDLLRDPKDDAELSMIVDLLRNDLGRLCVPRSVRVAEHKRLESYQNVHHLVSIVIGELHQAVTYGDLLRATFPGGSITGCPKIRSMEIIDELEPHVRHVYTGAIGYLGWHQNLDLNVAIRTALVRGGTCFFSVGGGIVHDSKEEDEYQETLHKGRTLFQVIERLGGRAS